MSSRLAFDPQGRTVAIITTRSLGLEFGDVFLIVDGRPYGLLPDRARLPSPRERGAPRPRRTYSGLLSPASVGSGRGSSNGVNEVPLVASRRRRSLEIDRGTFVLVLAEAVENRAAVHCHGADVHCRVVVLLARRQRGVRIERMRFFEIAAAGGFLNLTG
jgi:hypothetical protein